MPSRAACHSPTPGQSTEGRDTADRVPAALCAALDRIVVPKASDVLAEQLRVQILTGRLPPGSLLPVERVLASAAGVSRAKVQQALQVLENDGLVTRRSGRSRRSLVRRPDATTLEHNLSSLMRLRVISLPSLLAIRDALEPTAAALAALNRTDTDLLRLDEASAHLRRSARDTRAFVLSNVKWHVAVVAASHNEIMEILLDLLARTIAQVPEVARTTSPATMSTALAAHERILTAIRAGSPDAAAAAMQKHLNGFRCFVHAATAPQHAQ